MAGHANQGREDDGTLGRIEPEPTVGLEGTDRHARLPVVGRLPAGESLAAPVREPGPPAGPARPGRHGRPRFRLRHGVLEPAAGKEGRIRRSRGVRGRPGSDASRPEAPRAPARARVDSRDETLHAGGSGNRRSAGRHRHRRGVSRSARDPGPGARGRGDRNRAPTRGKTAARGAGRTSLAPWSGCSGCRPPRGSCRSTATSGAGVGWESSRDRIDPRFPGPSGGVGRRIPYIGGIIRWSRPGR